jgi:hypothetical protein
MIARDPADLARPKIAKFAEMFRHYVKLCDQNIRRDKRKLILVVKHLWKDEIHTGRHFT